MRSSCGPSKRSATAWRPLSAKGSRRNPERTRELLHKLRLPAAATFSGIPVLARGIQFRMKTPNAAAAGTFSIAGELTVNRLGFGSMRLTGEGIWGGPKDPAECKRVLKRLLDLNVNFIDTADAYGPDVSENLIAEALHPYPKGLVIATKGGLTRQGPNLWQPVGRW